jgi:Tropinone reductase 1
VPADREKLMDTVKATFGGKLDILVNNAGQTFLKPAAECTAEDYSHVMATNLESSFHLCQLAHPLLVRASIAGGGSVVHVSSVASYLGYPGLVLYCISKGTNPCMLCQLEVYIAHCFLEKQPARILLGIY